MHGTLFCDFPGFPGFPVLVGTLCKQNISCVEYKVIGSDDSAIKIILNVSSSENIYQICMIFL